MQTPHGNSIFLLLTPISTGSAEHPTPSRMYSMLVVAPSSNSREKEFLSHSRSSCCSCYCHINLPFPLYVSPSIRPYIRPPPSFHRSKHTLPTYLTNSIPWVFYSQHPQYPNLHNNPKRRASRPNRIRTHRPIIPILRFPILRSPRRNRQNSIQHARPRPIATST
ncbi:uncharacterized protein HMPREF1120_05983 [Exophiala dermatitidis NIH/UT8656]|uniref:Uncharacterized protein n=1 Tax=Exophiala dermatitidis (strain ATCC 34100 / CBS 525.76 / NIH/UT8656) TaxID=858893 RepID=H6C2P5_EXODN|nr:uncharacterized protein HMPREF1120_05983 [Exophiala dermatitidis NIH/UT8656]EHY57963.1 hypothetical protein HMPREF1120_05983 [Exophiala dermatitidis NIH/UT8656]